MVQTKKFEYINKTVEKENLNENVKILGFINDIEMISIYKNCQAVLMPTLLVGQVSIGKFILKNHSKIFLMMTKNMC